VAGELTLEALSEDAEEGVRRIRAEVDENGNLIFKISLPENPWTSVTLAGARRYWKAVRRYVDEIAFSHDDPLDVSSSLLLRLK